MSASSPQVRVSPNFNDRPDGVLIDMLVLHYTGMQTCDAALDRLCDPDTGVSAHYVIEEDGTVHRLVDEDKRAWHAGVSWWRGAADINGRSIGIELVNPGHEFGLSPFPQPQMQALVALSRAILNRHPIALRNVVGHADVAPRRKQDPGELFDWSFLAAHGVGLWVADAQPAHATDDELNAMLAAFGYEIDDLHATLRAFQRHFRPSCVDGRADEETVGLLKALLDSL